MGGPPARAGTRPFAPMTPKRILHLITTLEPDGAQTQLLDLARRIDPARYGVEIAYLYKRGTAIPRSPDVPAAPGGRTADRFVADDVPIHDLSREGRFDPLVLFRLARMIRRERFDLVHTHLVHAGIVGKAAARLAGSIPVVATRHYASEGKEGTLLYRVEDRMTSGCAAVIAVSASVRRHLVEHAIAPADRIVVIPNGVDLDLFDPSRYATRTKRTDVDLVIGSTGRLCEQKGHFTLVEAAPAILARHPHARIEIVGAGPLRGELQSRARGLGVAERVLFRGSVPHDEIPGVIAGWDLFVMPSQWEGFGIAAAEAMAMEKAVVASAVEGLTELVLAGTTGVLVPPGRPEALAEAIARLLDDGDLRARMGRAARERVRDLFSIQRAAERTEEVYRSVFARPSLSA
jgi:glycosyltransferase involved in cell wall biosynthesis